MTAWTDHCKNYSEENGCTYKEAMTRGKSSYSSTTGGKINIKKIVRKVRNSTKKGSQLFNEHGHLIGELDKTGKISTKLNQLNNTVGKINDTIDTIDGGKFNFKNVTRKVRNSTKKGSQLFNEHGHLVGELDKSGKISTKLNQLNNTVGKINDTIDTIDGGKFNFKNAARKAKHTVSKVSKVIDKYAPLVEMIAPEFAPEIESIRMANKGIKKINGSGRKNPYILNGGSFKVHGGSVGHTQSSMISSHHPSFSPNQPKSIKKRQTEN